MSSACVAATYDEPMYYLKFSIARAAVDVRLNDIPVLHHDAAGLTSSEKPVPESIIDGENLIVINMAPLKDDDNLFVDGKFADVELIVREKNAPLTEYETLIHIKMDAVTEKDNILAGSDKNQGKGPALLSKFEDDEIVAQRSADIESPFPRWAWQDGVDIEQNKKTFDELFEQYRNVYSTLKSEDMEKIKLLYSEAAKEFSAAYHYDDVSHGHRIMSTGSLVGDNDWTLGNIQNLVDKGIPLNLDVYANGKLARIVDNKGDEIVIMYLNRSARMISLQKFGFYKNEDNEWIMIR